jgi:hypothetical protein
MAYDNNGGNRPPARDKNVLDDPRLTLSAPTPGVDKAWAKMNWGFFGNNGHLVVWTNDPEDQTEKNANGKIGVKIPAQDYEKFLSLIDLAIDLPPGEKNGMDVIDYSYYGRERSEKPEVQATIWVGKNKEGEVWLSLISKDNSRPKIQFKFGKTMYHAFKHGDGQPFSDAETSVLAARAHLRTIRRALDHLFPTTYVPRKRTPMVTRVAIAAVVVAVATTGVVAVGVITAAVADMVIAVAETRNRPSPMNRVMAISRSKPM